MEFGEQHYSLVPMPGRPVIDSDSGDISADHIFWLCQGCGSLIVDKSQHNFWHRKTRSII